LSQSAASLSWQAVVIKIRFESLDTLSLGLENHVCEVQLLLRPVVDPEVMTAGRRWQQTLELHLSEVPMNPNPKPRR
jgi:hypothetical protein